VKSFRLEDSGVDVDPDPTAALALRRRNMKSLIASAAAVLLMFAWSHDAFDHFLWRVHLNHSTCIQNVFGATFCGDAAERY